MTAQRQPAASIDPLFVERWSPRSFADTPLGDEDVASLFEAARWSPSCFNEQPWLFVYGRSSEDHGRIADLLPDGNRVWAEKAPLLGVVFARRGFTRNGKPNRWAQFDSGAASFGLALQAQKLGLAAHFMGGFDADASYEALGVSKDEYEAMAAFAVGHQGEATALPEDLREREAPSDRLERRAIAIEGRNE